MALEELAFRNTKPQMIVHRMSEVHGTPIQLTRLNIRGALPWIARPYSVREPIYRSEFAAESTNMRIAALMMWFKTLIPASVVAKTKGLAAAPVFELFAVNRSYRCENQLIER